MPLPPLLAPSDVVAEKSFDAALESYPAMLAAREAALSGQPLLLLQ